MVKLVFSEPLGIPNGSYQNKYAIGAVIGAASTLLSNGIGAISQHIANKKGMAFQREMWDKQTAYQDKVNAEERAYQDKVNAENRAWNDESNVRARIEKAGYNPFLYNGGASGSASLSDGVSLGGAPSPASVPNVEPLFDANSLASSMSSFSSALSTLRDNNEKNYNFNRRKSMDAQLDSISGTTAGTDVAKTQAELKLAQETANKASAERTILDLQSAFDAAQAYDENGVPMVDEAGKAMSNLQAREKANLKTMYKSLDKLTAEIVNLSRQGKILDIDKLLKEYDLNHMQPELLKQVQTSIRKLNSDIRVNQSQYTANMAAANASNASADYTKSLKQTEDVLRQLKQQSLRNENDLKELEFVFGGKEKLINLYNLLTPKTTMEGMLYISDGLSEFLGLHKGKSAAELRNKFGRMSEAEISDFVDRYTNFMLRKNGNDSIFYKNDSTYFKTHVGMSR